MRTSLKFGSAAVVLAIAAIAAAPAAAVTFSWVGNSDFDIESYAITPVFANTISVGGGNGPIAHSHGQNVNFTITGVVDGVSQTLYSQLLTDGSEQAFASLGTLSFTGGLVSEIGFGCDNCSDYTYHNFGAADITLGAAGVPEAATWAMLIAGFGMTGAAMRRRQTVAA